MNKSLVSVVMPAYNARETLAESIESVLSQTYEHIELVIVDDGSTDGSADIADEFAIRDTRVRVFRSIRQGVVEARNRATRESRGRLLAFCDSDDLWHQKKLSRQVDFMQSCGSLISATGFQRIDESGNPISGPISISAKIGRSDLLVTNSVCCASVMYDVDALGKLYMFDYRRARDLPMYMRVGGAKPLHEDYIAWANLLSTGLFINGLNEVLTFYRVRRKSHSSNKVAAAVARWYINGNVLGVPFHKNVVLIAQYGFNALWRRLRWRAARFHAGWS